MKTKAHNPDQSNQVVVTFLNLLLADEYVLYTKTRTAHWNVSGSNHFETHVFLENQFNTLDIMIDEIADQIRSLGHYALGSLKDFLSIAQMSDDHLDLVNSGRIFETLLNDHETIIRIIQHEILPVSDKFKNLDTADFLTGILVKHIQMVRKLNEFISKTEFIDTSSIRTNTNQIANIRIKKSGAKKSTIVIN